MDYQPDETLNEFEKDDKTSEEVLTEEAFDDAPADEELFEKPCEETSEKAVLEAVDEAVEEAPNETIDEVAETVPDEIAEEEEVTEEPSEEPAENADSDEAEAEEDEEETEEGEEEAEEEEPEEEPEEEETPEEAAEVPAEEEKVEKGPFKLTAPENLDDILANVCCKRGRKLIFAPKEVLIEGTFTVLGTDKKNEEGIKVKDILDAEIKEGLKLGYLDKFDGLKTSEIKEEYEDDIVYELAEQEFKKTGILLDGDKIKVYVFDWDLSACHHVGDLDKEESAKLIPYLEKRDDYSFGICGIITGGKAKRVTRDKETGKLIVTKEKCGNIGMEIDVSILKRKD